jgi:hypothetical protein
MSVWLVVGDSELRSLLLAIGEEAGIPLAAIDPETVASLLASEDKPSAMLVSRRLIPTPLDPAGLHGIDRLAVASGDLDDQDGLDGIGPGHFLKLPASLDDVEITLRWLAGNGQGNGQLEPSPSNDSSSRLA